MSRRVTREADRRTRYTRQVIKDAYLELLSEIQPSKITVTELCRRADINRGTFYLHYEDLPRVMEELENEVYDEIIAFINGSLADENNRQNLSDDFFVSGFNNKNLQKILYESYYTERLYEKVIVYAESLLAELCVESGQLGEVEAKLFATFMVHACLRSSRELSECPREEIVERSAFINKLVKALFAAAVDPYELNEAFRKRLP